jgi:hypothetical protein
MSIHYVDASAWVKKYLREEGSDWILAFALHRPLVACAELGLVEVLATIVRRHAATGVSEAKTSVVFESARNDFKHFSQVPWTPEVLALTGPLLLKHHLRGADCIHLASAIWLRTAIQSTTVVAGPVTFIASDTELLRAAAAEGFTCLDPQLNPPLPVVTP